MAHHVANGAQLMRLRALDARAEEMKFAGHLNSWRWMMSAEITREVKNRHWRDRSVGLSGGGAVAGGGAGDAAQVTRSCGWAHAVTVTHSSQAQDMKTTERTEFLQVEVCVWLCDCVRRQDLPKNTEKQ
jgi:hypothetical protein